MFYLCYCTSTSCALITLLLLVLIRYLYDIMVDDVLRPFTRLTFTSVGCQATLASLVKCKLIGLQKEWSEPICTRITSPLDFKPNVHKYITIIASSGAMHRVKLFQHDYYNILQPDGVSVLVGWGCTIRGASNSWLWFVRQDCWQYCKKNRVVMGPLLLWDYMESEVVSLRWPVFSTGWKVSPVVSRQHEGCSGVQGQGPGTAFKARHGCLAKIGKEIGIHDMLSPWRWLQMPTQRHSS